DAAASKPFGFMPFYPGPGVGGHCIPVDPMYLSWRVRQFGGAARFIELAREINAAMPDYCVDRVEELLGAKGRPLAGAAVLVLGLAYKANVGDTRESPSLDVMRLLVERGADVQFHDAHVAEVEVADQRLANVDLDSGVLESSDVV